jgi:hypothetical protein
MAKIKTLTKEQLEKKKIKDLIFAPLISYFAVLVISMLAFSDIGDRVWGLVLFAIVGAIFFLSSITAKQVTYKINVYYFVFGLLGIFPLVSWYFHN